MSASDFLARADLSNWRTGPFNRWAFQHVEQIVACATIADDPAHRLHFDATPIGLNDFALRLQDGSSIDLQQFLARTCSDALVVLHDGRIVFEAYDNGMTADSRHILMSASKSVIGLLCGVLVEHGLLDLDATLASSLPEVAATVYGQATPRDLLDMRIAPGFDEATRKAYEAASGWQPATTWSEATGLHDFFSTLPPPSRPHRGPFAYVSANTDLLGWVIERCTGRTVASLLSELLWSPMGAAAPAAITLDRRGAARCTGGICATARDFARLGQLLVDDGASGVARQVLPRAWIDDIATQGDRDSWAQGEFAQSFAGLKMHYRSGWYAMDDVPQLLFAMGIHGQSLFIDRAHRLVVAKLSSQSDPIDATMFGLTLRAVAEIRRLVC